MSVVCHVTNFNATTEALFSCNILWDSISQEVYKEKLLLVKSLYEVFGVCVSIYLSCDVIVA